MLRLLTLVAILLIAACATRPAPSPLERPIRVLYLSQSVGFVHETVRRPLGGLAPSELALREMAADSGAFTVELTQDARDITPARLAELDVLVFSTTGALPIDAEAWAAIEDWIESGRGGFVGIHSAADTSLAFDGGDEVYARFLGGRFDGHPWTEGTPIRLQTHEPDHPLAAMWPDGTDLAEEIYQYSGFDPGSVRVLQSLDMDYGLLRRPYPVPVTWVKRIGQGRLFYTNLGHTPSTWDDPRFRTQIVTAIRWAGHRLEAPDAPNPDVQAEAAVAAFRAFEGLPPGPSDAPRLAPDIRALQALQPEPPRSDPARWNAARAALRNALAQ